MALTHLNCFAAALAVGMIAVQFTGLFRPVVLALSSAATQHASGLCRRRPIMIRALAARHPLRWRAVPDADCTAIVINSVRSASVKPRIPAFAAQYALCSGIDLKASAEPTCTIVPALR